MVKNVINQSQRDDAKRLMAIYKANSKRLGLTQEKLGVLLGGSGQSTASNYLNAITALNLKAAIIFARELKVDMSEFSPSLASLIGSSENSNPLRAAAMAALEAAAEGMDEEGIAELAEHAEIIRRRRKTG